jgi:hypothetical protein
MLSILIAAFELVLIVLASLFGIAPEDECEAPRDRGERCGIESRIFHR